MPDDAKARFHAEVRRQLVPLLRAEGFRGSGTTYRRTVGRTIQVLNIQGSTYGGKAAVNLGLDFDFLPTSPPDRGDWVRLHEYECEFRCRMSPDDCDHWWEYGASEGEASASVAGLVEVYRAQGEPYLRHWADAEAAFRALPVGTAPTGPNAKLMTTPERLALVAGWAHLAFGEPRRAQEFAEWGLAKVGTASFLGPKFQKLLAEIQARSEGLGGLSS